MPYIVETLRCITLQLHLIIFSDYLQLPFEVMYSTKGKREKPKSLKDPEAPKKPASSFIHFCMKERANVQKELLNTDLLLNCNTVSAEVTKELSKRWATLDSETRKVYEEASLKDRKRYEKEKKMYKPSKEFLKKKAEFEGAPKFSPIESPIPKATETVTDQFEDYFNFLHINWKKVEFYLPNILNTRQVQQANPGYTINQTQIEVSHSELCHCLKLFPGAEVVARSEA